MSDHHAVEDLIDENRALAAKVEELEQRCNEAACECVAFADELLKTNAKLATSMKSHELTSAAYSELRQDYDTLSRQYRELEQSLDSRVGNWKAAEVQYRDDIQQARQRIDDLELKNACKGLQADLDEIKRLQEKCHKQQTALTACRATLETIANGTNSALHDVGSIAIFCKHALAHTSGGIGGTG